ncbi:tetratricopeptide repeat protein [Zoogloea sp.]|uniref:tetratricopeptide repeat protein n=1 Tax=Zoogloea sp. TaxID=49181 RepID=UPI001E106DB6|nr:tetratricopeptide repeat protein [Zoogloea sp.]MBK6653500.1 tetratricopeptide repeat protein [Zoogloea sp.]
MSLIVSFGSQTEAFAQLPLELLHDQGQFLFARPHAALTRAFDYEPAADFFLSTPARILFAWARPEGAGHRFDPAPHEALLRSVFGDCLCVLPDATLRGLKEALQASAEQRQPFALLHLLAHGGHDGLSGLIALNAPDGSADWVEAGQLGHAIRGKGVQLAFLCSCQSGITGDASLSGVAQQLLSPAGGNLKVVIATQANLPVARSAELAAGFYHALTAQAGVSPGHALASARARAYEGTPLRDAWSIPICLARPWLMPKDAAARALDHATRNTLPPTRDSFQPRPEVMAQIRDALAANRLISLVGLPGIGKTELGKECARAYGAAHSDRRVIYQAINRGLAPGALRGLIATSLGHAGVPENDAGLGRLLDAQPTLLVLDNAEDMMASADTQTAFARQLDHWLANASALQVLLTTRWAVGETRAVRELPIDIPPMSRAETDALLKAELALGEVQTPEIRAAWAADPAWQRLLDFLDGHPRSVWLVSRHFDGPRASLAKVVDRLERARAQAVVDPALIGRQDAHALLSDADAQRMRSLVASIDFSFDVLAERHPQAAAAFLQLAAFPGGVPESVAIASLAADIDAEGWQQEALATDSLDQLYRYHLLEWQGSRTHYPMPLQWYAEHKAKGTPRLSPAARQAALAAYADFVDTLNTGLIRDQSPNWVADWLKEERTLLSLARPPAPAHTPAPGPSALARIAGSARNLMMMSQRLGVWQQLTEAGRDDARARLDIHGEANTLKALGDLQLRNDRLDDARKAYENALELYRKVEDRLGEANTLRALGDLHLRNARLDDARKAYENALELYRKVDARLGEANTLQALGDLHLRNARLDDARKAYENALELFRKVEDRLGEANTLKALGDLHLRNDRLDDARKAYENALELYRKVDARLGEANTLKALGDLHLRNDRLDDARKAYENALELYRKVDARLGEANTLQALGDLHLRNDRLDDARKAYENALELYRKVDARLGEANTLQALGDLHLRNDRLDDARKAYENALELYRKVEDRLGEANTLQGLGLLALISQDPAEAFRQFVRALHLHVRVDNKLGQEAALGYAARAAMALEQTDRALFLAGASLAIGLEIKDRFGQSISLQVLLNLFQDANDGLGFAASVALYRNVAGQLDDVQQQSAMDELWQQLASLLPVELMTAVRTDPQAALNQALANARQRFGEHDPLELDTEHQGD